MKKKRRVVAFLLIVMLLLTDVIPVSAISAAPDCGPEFYTLHAEESGENAQKKEESFLEERSLEEEQNEEYVTNRKGITVKKSLLCDDPNCLEEHVGNEIDVPEEYRVKVSKADLLSDRALERLMTDVYVGMTVSGNAEVAFWGTPATAGPHQVRITDGPLAGVKGTGWCINHGAANPGEGFWQWCSYSAECTSISGNFADWKITLTPPGACTPGSVLGYQRVGMSATVEFEEPNGNLEIAKSSAKPEFTDGNDSYTFANAVYGLYQNGKEVGRTLTDSHGWGIFKGYKKGNYILKEITPPKGYALDPTEYPVTIHSSQTTRQEVKDIPQSDSVAILLEKIDKETDTNKPQGAASLEGAEFTIKFYGGQFDSDPEKVGKKPLRTWVMRTDKNGRITLSDSFKVSGDPFFLTINGEPTLPLGTLTMQETRAPKGYILNPEVFVRKIASTGTADRVETYNMPTIPETVARGDLEIKKYNQADDGTITYLQGVRFTITSKTTGKQVADIITDRKGWGSTYDRQHNRGGLPFDTYIVEEDISTTPEGMENVKPFEVTISQDKQVLEYEVENKDIVAPVKLVKQDATTGKTIPLANAEFELLDAHKNPITVKTYNPYKEYRTFKTDASGSFTLPKRIKYGTYYFREVKAPNGYLYNGQEIQFKVTQTLDWSQPIVVTYTDQPAKGKIRIEKTDGTTNQPLPGGASFEIRAKDNIVTPDGTVRAWAGTVVDRVTTDRSGKATSKELFLGNYEVIETQAPNGYLLNRKRYPVSLVYQDQNTNIVYGDVTVTDQPGKGKIRVTKKDAETLQTIQREATFEIKAKTDIVTPEGTVRARKGEVVDTITTNRSGKATSKELFFGTYEVKEINAPNGYLLNHNVFDVTLNYQDQETELVYSDVDVTDTPVKGNIRLEKRDAETDKIIPGGATFEIRAKNDILTPDGTVRARKGEVVDTITTKTDGKAESKLLYLGDYEVQETQAPNGYLLDHTVYQVSLRYVDQETKVVYGDVKATDKPAMGQFNLYKKDKETGKVISGKAVFEIYAKNDIVTPDGTVRVKAGTMVERISTEPNGYAVSKKLYLGNYTIQEVAAPDGYIINPMKKDITLSYANQWTEIVYEEVNLLDEPVKGKIRVEKQDAETGRIIPKPANFIIIAKNNIVTTDGSIRAYAGEVVDRIQTDETGKATSKELYLGTYLVRETQAPTGYLLQKESYEVTLSYKDQDTKLVYADVTVTDQPAMGQIKVKKTDVETNQIIPTGATYEIRAKENIVTPDRTIRVKKGELVDTITTGKDGTATSKKLYLGTYEVQESKAPEGYVVNKTKYEAVLTYKDQTTEVVTTKVTGTDEPVKGKIQLRKSDVETEQIIPAGAIFDVIAKEDIVTPEGTIRARKGQLVDTITTGEDGTATSKALYLGTYLVKETKAPEGYLLNEQVHEAVLTYKDQVTELVYDQVKATDQPAMGQIKILKQDEETGKNILGEATFEIRAKENIVTPDGTIRVKKGTLVETIKTNNEGVALSKKLYLGSYTVQETKAPFGYAINSTIYDVKLIYQDQLIEVVTSTQKVPDMAVKGRIHVTKTDVETNQVIPNKATFQIIAKNDIVTLDGTVRAKKGEVVDTITTNRLGKATSKVLYLGTYLVKEVQAPNRYLLNEKVYEATLSYEGQDTRIVFADITVTDRPVMGQIKVVKKDVETDKIIPVEATFEIKAKTDIVTPDGTVRAKAGELVDIIKTGKDGKAQSKKLYLGTYLVQEVAAPNGYLINEEVHEVTLTYKDQNTEVIYADVIATDKPAMGQIKIKKTDATTNQIIPGGATFEIKAKENVITPDGTVRVKAGTVVETITTGEDGIATSKALYLGSYTVLEVQQPDGYLLNKKPFNVSLAYKDQTTEIVLVEKTVTNTPTKVILTKKELNSDKLLEGVTFKLWKKANETQEGKTFVTGEDGTLVITHLVPGMYCLQEVSTIPGYVVSDQIYEFTIAADGRVNKETVGMVEAQNDFTKIDFTKHDLTTEKEIEGGRYQVLDQEGTVIDEWIGTKKPHRVNKLVAGQTYIFREILAPEGYLLAQDVTFTVDPTGEVQKVQMFDELVMGTITVEKTDAETKEQITGAIFKVYAAEDIVTPDGTLRIKEGTLVETITTEQGRATTKPLFLGKYRVREQKAAPGYVNDPKDDYVTLEYQDQNTSIVGETVGVKNRPTTIVVEKICNETKQPLAGVQFAIWNKSAKEETIQIHTTGADGKIIWKHVLPGRYCVQEMKSAEGYVLDAKIHEIVVDEDGRIDRKEIGTLILQNEFTKIDLSKHDISTGKEIKGGTYQVLDQEGHVLDEWIGTGTPHRIEKLIVGKTYIFREMIAPEGYLLAQDVPFTIAQTKEVQKVEMYDELAMGRIAVKKTDHETKEPVTGALFKVYAAEDIVTPDGTVRAKKDELVDVIQTEKGVAQTQKLFLGTYRVVESQPSPGYAKDNQEHLVELKYKDQNTALVLKTLEVENKPTTLIVEKVRKGTKVVLEGVTFKVWNKADETKTAIEYVTDETGRFVLKYLIPGVYCIQEVKPKEGYLLNKTIYEVVVNEDGAVILEEGREPKGQAILTVENALEVKIETPKPAVKTGDSLPGSFWSTMALLNLSILMLIARDSLFSFGRKRSILNHRRKQKREGDV